MKKVSGAIMKNHQLKLIVVLGPTASGKSVLALKLAEKINGEIVSADSRQIYQDMDIGTAKPFRTQNSKLKTQKCDHKKKNNLNQKCFLADGIRHYLIDIAKPNQKFSLFRYQKLAFKIIKDIQKRDKIPFLVGGTGLYIQAIVDNLKIPKVKPDKKLRQKLEKLTAEQLSQKLQKLDLAALKFVDHRNKRRLIRALEVCLTAKKPFSRQRKKGKKLFEVLQIGLKPNKKELRLKIAKRTEKMLAMGMIDETKKLLKKYSPNLPSMSGIGYREIIKHLNGEISLIQAENLINQRTWQYSQRQMTWFKKDKRIRWIKNDGEAEKIIGKFLNKKKKSCSC